MKIITWNVNGLRSVWQKGFLAFVSQTKPDILCLQEIKIQPEQLEKLEVPKGYCLFSNCAQRKGYSGVAIYLNKSCARSHLAQIENSLGLDRFDDEGRFLQLKFPKFTLINLYLPHGGRQKENLDYKLKVYDFLLKRLARRKNRPLILAGDFNVAHQEIDLARPRQNQNNIMFTPAERKQLDDLITLGFIDTFRVLNPEGGHYTWWPYFADARKRNLGWRIDYCFVSKLLLPRLKKSFILSKVLGSDHCPVGVELDNRLTELSNQKDGSIEIKSQSGI